MQACSKETTVSRKPPLFQGQGFRLASIGVGLVIGLLAVVVSRAITSDEPLSSGFLIGVSFGLVIAVAAAAVGLLLGRKVFGQRLELALRPASETKWRHGWVEASPGHLRFHRYKLQIRFVSGDPVDFAVHAVGLDSGRRPSKKQLWSVNPSLHVIDIETDQGPLQLGLQAHQVDTIRMQLQPTGS